MAIFSYRQFIGEGNAYETDKPHIGCLGHWMPVHGRHIRQQSTYTFCIQKIGAKVAFVTHETADKNRPFRRIRHRDNEIIKYEMPVAERDEALRDLRKMNVTEYSLFNTDDALVRSVLGRALERPKLEG